MNVSSLPILLIVVCSALLSACATNTDYLEATTLPPVKPPEGLDKDRLGQLYPLPEQKETRSPKQFSVPFPPTVGVQEDANLASIQTMDGEFWVTNARSPAETWTQLISFWQQKKIPMVTRDLERAIITTDWFDEAVQPGSKVRYRLRLEQGLQPNTTDIFIYNEKLLPGEQESATQLGERLLDRAHGDWLANQLVAVMNKADASVGDSYLAATINLPQKVRLTELNDEPVLVSIASESRLNRAFSEALDQNGLLIYDRDLQQAVYHFDQYKLKSQSRWFDFFSFNDSKPNKTSNHPVSKILSSLPDEADVNVLFPKVENSERSKTLSGLKGFLLIIREHPQRESEKVIYIRDTYGRLLARDEVIALLDTIRLRLI